MWHKGSFSPPFPSSGSPAAASPSRGAVAGASQAPLHPRTPLGMEPQSGHLCAISQVAKNKTRKGRFGPHGSQQGWEQRWPGGTRPPPGSAASKANKREGSQHSPIALPLFPVCSWHGAALGWQCQDNSPLSSVPLHNLAPSGEGTTGQDPTAFLSSWGGDKHCGVCGGSVGLVWVPFWHARQEFYAQIGCAQAATVPWGVGCQSPCLGGGQQLITA